MTTLFVIMGILAAAAVFTEGKPEARAGIMMVFALAGALYCGIFVVETIRGHVTNILVWVLWFGKMVIDPGDRQYRATTYRAYGYPDPLGVATLLFGGMGIYLFLGFLI